MGMSGMREDGRYGKSPWLKSVCAPTTSGIYGWSSCRQGGSVAEQFAAAAGEDRLPFG